MENQSTSLKSEIHHENDGHVTQQGWLEHAIKNDKLWDRRWVVIAKGVLSCYKTKPINSTSSSIVTLQLNLTDYACSIPSKHKHSTSNHFYFYLTRIDNSNDIIKFRTYSSDDQTQWIAKLCKFTSIADHDTIDVDNDDSSKDNTNNNRNIRNITAVEYLQLIKNDSNNNDKSNNSRSKSKKTSNDQEDKFNFEKEMSQKWLSRIPRVHDINGLSGRSDKMSDNDDVYDENVTNMTMADTETLVDDPTTLNYKISYSQSGSIPVDMFNDLNSFIDNTKKQQEENEDNNNYAVRDSNFSKLVGGIANQPMTRDVSFEIPIPGKNETILEKNPFTIANDELKSSSDQSIPLNLTGNWGWYRHRKNKNGNSRLKSNTDNTNKIDTDGTVLTLVATESFDVDDVPEISMQDVAISVVKQSSILRNHVNNNDNHNDKIMIESISQGLVSNSGYDDIAIDRDCDDSIISTDVKQWRKTRSVQITNPLVCLLFIGNYEEDPDLRNLQARFDYRRMIHTFHDIWGYSVLFLCTAKNGTSRQKLLKPIRNGLSTSQFGKQCACRKRFAFKDKWDWDEIDSFSENIKEHLENKYGFYDSLMFVVGGHGEDDECIIDSRGEVYQLLSLFAHFQSKHIPFLTDKPKIFFVDVDRGALRHLPAPPSSDNDNSDTETKQNSNDQDVSEFDELKILNQMAPPDSTKNQKKLNTLDLDSDEDNSHYKEVDYERLSQQVHREANFAKIYANPPGYAGIDSSHGSVFIRAIQHVFSNVKQIRNPNCTLNDIYRQLCLSSYHQTKRIALQQPQCDDTLNFKVSFDKYGSSPDSVNYNIKTIAVSSPSVGGNSTHDHNRRRNVTREVVDNVDDKQNDLILQTLELSQKIDDGMIWCIPIMNPVSLFRIVWNVTVVFILIYSCISIPMTLAFDIKLSLNHWIGIFGFCCDLFLLFDIILNFRTSYVDNHEKDGFIVTDPNKIANRFVNLDILTLMHQLTVVILILIYNYCVCY